MDEPSAECDLVVREAVDAAFSNINGLGYHPDRIGLLMTH
jgi:hypothetical protein